MVQLTKTFELQPLSCRGILCLHSNPPLVLPTGFTVTLARGTYKVSILFGEILRLLCRESEANV
ncbi:hypothetical protein E2C01_004335 [Portunus trituberculatus]|uniref:Uncharacterized protein n=1 Tax=Portunus trituberculatus TaxID=210409 RepID=A0A5B7CSS0_PORTR|nr:hypothetical protein [Portunus trituberculatus]